MNSRKTLFLILSLSVIGQMTLMAQMSINIKKIYPAGDYEIADAVWSCTGKHYYNKSTCILYFQTSYTLSIRKTESRDDIFSTGFWITYHLNGGGEIRPSPLDINKNGSYTVIANSQSNMAITWYLRESYGWESGFTRATFTVQRDNQIPTISSNPQFVPVLNQDHDRVDWSKSYFSLGDITDSGSGVREVWIYWGREGGPYNEHIQVPLSTMCAYFPTNIQEEGRYFFETVVIDNVGNSVHSGRTIVEYYGPPTKPTLNVELPQDISIIGIDTSRWSEVFFSIGSQCISKYPSISYTLRMQAADGSYHDVAISPGEKIELSTFESYLQGNCQEAGALDVFLYAVDVLGNKSFDKVILKYDLKRPEIRDSISSLTYQSEKFLSLAIQWYEKDIGSDALFHTLQIEKTDSNGTNIENVALDSSSGLYYSLHSESEGDWRRYTARISVSRDCQHSFGLSVTDQAGNSTAIVSNGLLRFVTPTEKLIFDRVETEAVGTDSSPEYQALVHIANSETLWKNPGTSYVITLTCASATQRFTWTEGGIQGGEFVSPDELILRVSGRQWSHGTVRVTVMSNFTVVGTGIGEGLSFSELFDPNAVVVMDNQVTPLKIQSKDDAGQWKDFASLASSVWNSGDSVTDGRLVMIGGATPATFRLVPVVAEDEIEGDSVSFAAELVSGDDAWRPEAPVALGQEFVLSSARLVNGRYGLRFVVSERFTLEDKTVVTLSYESSMHDAMVDTVDPSLGLLARFANGSIDIETAFFRDYGFFENATSGIGELWIRIGNGSAPERSQAVRILAEEIESLASNPGLSDVVAGTKWLVITYAGLDTVVARLSLSAASCDRIEAFAVDRAGNKSSTFVLDPVGNAFNQPPVQEVRVTINPIVTRVGKPERIVAIVTGRDDIETDTWYIDGALYEESATHSFGQKGDSQTSDFSIRCVVTFKDGSSKEAQAIAKVETTRSGKLYANETWSGTHHLDGVVEVPSGITLTISNCSVIPRGAEGRAYYRFGDNRRIVGLAGSNIDISDSIFGQADGMWWGGVLAEGTLTAKDSTFYKAIQGIALVSSGAANASISGCTFNATNTAIHIVGSIANVIIDGCTFNDIVRYAIKEDDKGRPKVINCTFNGELYYAWDRAIIDLATLNSLDGNAGNQ